MKEPNIPQRHWEKYLQEIKEAEEMAASVMVDFAKSNRNIPTEAEAFYVQYCFEKAGCNNSMTPDGIRGNRVIEAQCILRNCITRTDRTELRKIETALNYILNL